MARFWEYYRKACVRIGTPDPGEYPARGPIFLWVTTDDKDETWRRLAPHIAHQIGAYSEWTSSAYGRPDGPFVPTNETVDLTQGGAYCVVDPDEAIELANDLGPTGELHLNPLLAGIDPAFASRMLDTVAERVLPFVDVVRPGDVR
jgi:hypothetical protein